jgi:hypothetical protein
MNKITILIACLFLISYSANAQRYRGYNDDYPKIRLALQGGWSYRTAGVSKDVQPILRDYLKGLKSGYNYGANATFFFSRAFGVGIEYNSFHCKNQLDGLIIIDTVTKKKRTGSLEDNITINFFGASITGREVFGRTDNFNAWGSFSLGYISYKDDGVTIDPIYITGWTVGVGTSLGLDVALSKEISIGAQVSYLRGVLLSATYTYPAGTSTIDFEDGKGEDISRIDVSGGLRLLF